MDSYQVISFYHFTSIEDPHLEVKRHHAFLENLDVRARIYIAYDGMNAQMSLLGSDAQKYIGWLVSDSRFSGVKFKIDLHHEHVLPRVTVKFREALVALGTEVDVRDGGEKLSPAKWKEMLQSKDPNVHLVDVRNHYESAIGHFEGADLPDLENFRDFPRYAEELVERFNPKETKVMMYCTGGIRCELYSALLKKKGFEEVYQLDGGVIEYGRQVGGEFWRGKLFVFDDRLSIAINEDAQEIISHCSFCDTLCDVYCNCANMDCNELFLCCPSCLETREGCCSTDCREAERRRPVELSSRPKPFRKWYHYGTDKGRRDESCGCLVESGAGE